MAIVVAAGFVFVAAGFGAYRDEFGRRQAKFATVILAVAVFVVGIPLVVHSLQRVEQGNAVASVAREVRSWAPDLRLNDISINRSVDPAAITVAVTGPAAPPDVPSLAGILADDLDSAVDVDVIFVPVANASAPAP